MDVSRLKTEILSVSGRVKVEGISVPGYPKLLQFKREFMDKPFVAEYKVNGANTRLLYLPAKDDFVAILRGGYLDQKMTDAAHRFESLFLAFFRKNPRQVLFAELLGGKTIANVNADYFQRYGFDKDAAYFVFDIYDLEADRFLKYGEVKQACEDYGLSFVPVLGVYEDFDRLVAAMKALDDVFEGAVLKDPEGTEVYKFRFDKAEHIFPERKKAVEKRPESDENVIVAHFMQGYPEEELGLKSGITKEEFTVHSQMMESLSDGLTRENAGEKVGGVVGFLMEAIKTHGDFDEETLRKIGKVFRSLTGRKVGRFLKR